MSTIRMGDDEFILYIRKTSDCKTPNNVLGSLISKWFKQRGILPLNKGQRVPCLWGEDAENVDEKILPKTATQFEFNRGLLPELYDYLDNLKVINTQ